MGVERIHKQMYIRIVSIAASLSPKMLSRLIKIKLETVFRSWSSKQSPRSGAELYGGGSEHR
jgi:hypothetical protein